MDELMKFDPSDEGMARRKCPINVVHFYIMIIYVNRKRTKVRVKKRASMDLGQQYFDANSYILYS